ncbi:MAG: recombination mediator RecR [Candidatus Uhrbacteria bacterium]
MTYPPPIQNLIDIFRRLPGVGPKSAERFVFSLLRDDGNEIAALIERLAALRNGIERCATCGTFAEASPCATCRDPRRDRRIICVIAEPAGELAIERTGVFRGVYHILGGLLAPIEGIGPEQLRIAELVERLTASQVSSAKCQLAPTAASGVSEVIFAFDPTIEGEATASYLARVLAPTNIRCTRIARGLPVGGDLEYADPVTLGDSLNGRREFAARLETTTGSTTPF